MPCFEITSVLILGASGQFGKRLCRRLVQQDGMHLLLAGRDKQKLQAAQKQLLDSNPAAKMDVVPCDIGSGLLELLYSRRPDAVIHLAGPFQSQDHRVAQACLQARVPYMDMADGREFVAQFSSLDAAAREKGIPLVTGASTVPALSAAIIDATFRQFSQLQAIDYGICAALKSGLGAATLRSVLSYCGKPYEILEHGKRATIYGLGRPRYHDFPAPLNRRFVVDCDIPDHSLFPARYPSLRQMNFGSCIDVPGLPQLLSVMSHCVRKGWIANWNFLSGFIELFMTGIKPFGNPDSGFFMRLEGLDPHGNSKKSLLEILARDGSGLEIPITPVVLLIKKMLKGECLPAGAYPCMSLFSLAEFMQELSSYPISWDWKHTQ